MRSDQENFIKMTVQALAEWGQHVGAVGWIVLGVLMGLAILALIAVGRWIWRGGLSRSRSGQLLGPEEPEEPRSED